MIHTNIVRRALLTLAVALTLGMASIGGASAADAATCSGSDCNNRDPATSGCDASAITVDSEKTRWWGKFELRYSRQCETNWIRVKNYSGSGSVSALGLRVFSDEGRGGNVYYQASNTPGLHYGNMVYSPGNDCAHGLVYITGKNEIDVALSSSGCTA